MLTAADLQANLKGSLLVHEESALSGSARMDVPSGTPRVTNSEPAASAQRRSNKGLGSRTNNAFGLSMAARE
jgi:hypothetical protein